MRKTAVEKVVRCLLAAWLLVATSVTSSTFVHAHSGGEATHQHDDYDHPTPHPVASVTHGDHHDGTVIISAANSHCHGYCVLLGAIAYQSTPVEPSGSTEIQRCGWEAVGLSTCPSVQALAKTAARDHPVLATPIVLGMIGVGEAKQAAFSCASFAHLSHLCDRARHERSGVLLA